MRYHKDLKMGWLHRFLHPEAVLVVMAKESSNPRWWVLYFNTIARRPLLLRQQAEIKVVSTGNTPGGIHWFAALMFLLSSSSSLETQLPLLPFFPDATAWTISGLHAVNGALHTRLMLRQTPLGTMIMKEIQCGTVGAASVAAQQLWC